ncbi:unnamed protein product, partial [Bubo scandiacus]
EETQQCVWVPGKLSFQEGKNPSESLNYLVANKLHICNYKIQNATYKVPTNKIIEM